MRRRYRRFSGYDNGRYYAARHISERQYLSLSFGGIDKDVEQIFLSLPFVKLESVFREYGLKYGASALSYARDTYPRWKSGAVRMGGMVAERLLNLVPLTLDTSTRFDLVKKVRAAHIHKAHQCVTCEPNDWRSKVLSSKAAAAVRANRVQANRRREREVKTLSNSHSSSAATTELSLTLIRNPRSGEH